jgi:hypothetical protein
MRKTRIKHPRWLISQSSERNAVISYFLDRGADPFYKNEDNENIFDIARDSFVGMKNQFSNMLEKRKKSIVEAVEAQGGGKLKNKVKERGKSQSLYYTNSGSGGSAWRWYSKMRNERSDSELRNPDSK